MEAGHRLWGKRIHFAVPLCHTSFLESVFSLPCTTLFLLLNTNASCSPLWKRVCSKYPTPVFSSIGIYGVQVRARDHVTGSEDETLLLTQARETYYVRGEPKAETVGSEVAFGRSEVRGNFYERHHAVVG